MSTEPTKPPIDRHDGVAVVRLEGEVDIARAPTLADTLRTAVDNHDFGLVLDMREATYLDSAGINLVFDLAERLRGRQQTLAMVIPERAVIERAVELVDLASVAGIHKQLDAAVGEVRQAAT